MKSKIERFVANNEAQSKQFATLMAPTLKAGDILALRGDLGSGKSFLCRHIIKNLCGNKVKVTSPTFNLLQIYDLKQYSIYHYDLYRLKDISEIYELGIEEAIDGHLCLIEWPELIESILPAETIYIDIEIINHSKRVISLKRPSHNS
jgi:tRNA threonylcarbamoyladenosine biosynthesis protein TsaE